MTDLSIVPNSNLILGAILLILCVFGYWAEQTRRGTPPLAALLTLVLGAFCAHLGLIPSESPLYSALSTYGVPLAIPLILSQLDLRDFPTHAKATLILFGIGVAGTLLGTMLGFFFLPLGEEGGKLAAILLTQFIGNPLNGAEVAAALNFQASVPLAMINAVDRLITSLLVLFWLVISLLPWVRGYFTPYLEDWGIRFGSTPVPTILKRSAPTRFDWVLGLAISAIAVLLGYLIAHLIRLPGSELLFTAIAILILSQLFTTTCDRLAGIEELGAVLLLLLFTTLGATTQLPPLLTLHPTLLGFASLILLSHLVTVLIVGKLFNLNFTDLLIASSATVGTPTLGVAMAVAQRWETLIFPAILCGTLGSIIAYPMGLILGKLLS